MSELNPNSASESCASVFALLSPFADGETTATETKFVQTHLNKCPRCVAHLSFVRASQKTLFSLPDVCPSVALTQRIARQTYARPTLLGRLAAWFAPLPVRAGLGVAAAALAGFAILNRQAPLVVPMAETTVNTEPTVTETKPTVKSVRSSETDSKMVTAPKTDSIQPEAVDKPTVAKPEPSRIVRVLPEATVEPVAIMPDAKSNPIQPNVPKAVVSIKPAVLSPKRSNFVGPGNPTKIAMNPMTNSVPITVSPTKPVVMPNVPAEIPVVEPVKVAAGEALSGDYSPESGKIRLGTRRPSAAMTVSLNATDKMEAGMRSLATNIGGSSPGDNPGIRGAIVSAPSSLN